MNLTAALAHTLELRPRESLLCSVGSFPRGAISEITGPHSSGRATLANVLLAAATARQEICAFIDTHDSFDPASAAASGVSLPQLLWVRCSGNAEHAFHAADALLHAGGLGVAVLDLCSLTPREANRIPLSYWYRFRRAIENTSTILAVLSDNTAHNHDSRDVRFPRQKRTAAPLAPCAALLVELGRDGLTWSGPPGFELLRAMRIGAAPRKPVRSQPVSFQAYANF